MSEERSSGQPDQKTVLVVDDDRLVQKSLQLILERQGLKVLLADDGNEALAHLRQNVCAVVLLDILIPDKDGLETLIAVRAHFPGVRVVVMSGGGTREGVDFLHAARKLGADAALRKPV